jgi:hypothetical protein
LVDNIPDYASISDYYRGSSDKRLAGSISFDLGNILEKSPQQRLWFAKLNNVFVYDHFFHRDSRLPISERGHPIRGSEWKPIRNVFPHRLELFPGYVPDSELRELDADFVCGY